MQYWLHRGSENLVCHIELTGACVKKGALKMFWYLFSSLHMKDVPLHTKCRQVIITWIPSHSHCDSLISSMLLWTWLIHHTELYGQIHRVYTQPSTYVEPMHMYIITKVKVHVTGFYNYIVTWRNTSFLE